MSKAYVNDSAMAEWKTKMDSINVNCLESIDGIETCLNSISDSFRGDYASDYTNSYKRFIQNVKSSHENLKDVEAFLDTIVDVMQNQ